MIIFWYGTSGTSTVPLVEFGSVAGLARCATSDSATTCDMSIEMGPDSRCCTSVASSALSPGFVVPNAQMIVCDVALVESAWIITGAMSATGLLTGGSADARVPG